MLSEHLVRAHPRTELNIVLYPQRVPISTHATQWGLIYGLRLTLRALLVLAIMIQGPLYYETLKGLAPAGAHQSIGRKDSPSGGRIVGLVGGHEVITHEWHSKIGIASGQGRKIPLSLHGPRIGT